MVINQKSLVMESTLNNYEVVIFGFVNQSMFLINSPRPRPIQNMLEWFRLANSFKGAGFAGFYEFENLDGYFFVTL
jgi:hypothetical protein